MNARLATSKTQETPAGYLLYNCADFPSHRRRRAIEPGQRRQNHRLRSAQRVSALPIVTCSSTTAATWRCQVECLRLCAAGGGAVQQENFSQSNAMLKGWMPPRGGDYLDVKDAQGSAHEIREAMRMFAAFIRHHYVGIEVWAQPTRWGIGARPGKPGAAAGNLGRLTSAWGRSANSSTYGRAIWACCRLFPAIRMQPRAGRNSPPGASTSGMDDQVALPSPGATKALTRQDKPIIL